MQIFFRLGGRVFAPGRTLPRPPVTTPADPGSAPPPRWSPWRAFKKTVRRLVMAVFVTPLVAGVTAVTSVATYVFMPLPATLPEERSQPEARASTVYAIDGTPIVDLKAVLTPFATR